MLLSAEGYRWTDKEDVNSRIFQHLHRARVTLGVVDRIF